MTFAKKFRHTLTGICAQEDTLLVRYSNSPETAKNWGDALNPYLIQKLSGKTVLHRQKVFNLGRRKVFSVIGSVLGSRSLKGLHIWGSGFKRDPGLLSEKPEKIYAVRGQLTRNVFIRNRVDCPEIYGDPGILVSEFYRPEMREEFRLGIIPHYVDKSSDALRSFTQMPEVKIIDIEQEIESFIDQVARCEMIASSSLHGLICAAAYGIPYCWIKLSDGIAGGNFKYHDYFSSFMQTKDYPDPLEIGTSSSWRQILSTGAWIDSGPDKQPLFESCPFKRNA